MVDFYERIFSVRHQGAVHCQPYDLLDRHAALISEHVRLVDQIGWQERLYLALALSAGRGAANPVLHRAWPSFCSWNIPYKVTTFDF